MTTPKTFKEVEDLWTTEPTVPMCNLISSQKWIRILAARTTKDLPKEPGSPVVRDTQKSISNILFWKKKNLPDGKQKFPIGKLSHWIEFDLTTDLPLLVMYIDPHYLDNWFDQTKLIIGCLPKRLVPLMRNLKDKNLLATGRLYKIRTMHSGKFLSPEIVFPYGGNSFDENLGHIEELSNKTHEETSLVYEHDFAMDDF